MSSFHPSHLVFRTLTFGVWALAAASVAYWVLKLMAAPLSGMVAPVAGGGGVTVDSAMIARALGMAKFTAPVAQAEPSSTRFALRGTVVGVSSHGVALIGIDGKPAKAVRVGAVVEDGLVLQSVTARQAHVGATMDGPASFVLDLPVTTR